MSKYNSYIYKAIEDYFRHNYEEVITEEEIDEMDRGDVLTLFLSWEGIYGYDSLIKKIMGYYDCKFIEIEKEVK